MNLWTVLKLLVACFVVGVVLAWIGRSPTAVLEQTWQTTLAALATLWHQFEALIGSGSDVVGYVLTGAVVVIPLWLLFLLVGALRRRR